MGEARRMVRHLRRVLLHHSSPIFASRFSFALTVFERYSGGPAIPRKVVPLGHMRRLVVEFSELELKVLYHAKADELPVTTVIHVSRVLKLRWVIPSLD